HEDRHDWSGPLKQYQIRRANGCSDSLLSWPTGPCLPTSPHHPATMTDTLLPNGTEDSGGDGKHFRKGCNPLAQTGRSKLQNSRASLNQQIIKQMRMRAGAENLLKATNNNKVKEMVLLELSYVNANLQRLMGQLEGLNSSVDVYQSTQ
ncbi:Rhophilin-2, partial [Ilyodon furcidens]